VQSLPAMVPIVIPLLLLMLPAMLTALAVVREKEIGSIINLYVTPVSRSEFLLCKQLPYVVLALAAVAVVWLLAWAQARATVYTITNARVLMKIGAALPVTYNIPFAQIATARLDLKPAGTGTIALETLGDTRLAVLALWPHLRPGRMKRTEPALRCIPDAERTARLLAEAAEARLAMPVVTRTEATPADAVAAE